MARRTGARKGISPVEKACLRLRQERFCVPAGQTLADALRGVGLEPEQFLAVSRGQMLPMEAVLAAGDEVQLVAVIAGG